MSKTKDTLRLERDIRIATHQMGTFGCTEVTIGFGGKERVDYMTYDTTGIFRCYEIKVSKSDFHSDSKLSFCGHYNYFVLTRELYNKVQDEIPDGIGVYVGQSCVKRPKKQDIDSKLFTTRRTIKGKSTEVSIPWTEMLKDSLIRSLTRDSQKLFKSETLYNREVDSWRERYHTLLLNVKAVLGEDALELMQYGELDEDTIKHIKEKLHD